MGRACVCWKGEHGAAPRRRRSTVVRVALRASAQSHVACDTRCVPLRVDVVRVGGGSSGVGVCEALVGQNQPRWLSGAVEVNLGGLKGSHWWRSERLWLSDALQHRQMRGGNNATVHTSPVACSPADRWDEWQGVALLHVACVCCLGVCGGRLPWGAGVVALDASWGRAWPRSGRVLRGIRVRLAASWAASWDRTGPARQGGSSRVSRQARAVRCRSERGREGQARVARWGCADE